jgi:hypothetical protein
VPKDIPEADWRQFRDVHKLLQDRFCQTALDDLAKALESGDGTPYERYCRVYQLLKDRDKELSRIFYDFRRSTAIQQLGIMRWTGLLTDEDLHRFSAETQRVAEGLASIFRE